MPYSSVSEIPASVKKRLKTAKKQRQWLHVWNSTYSRTKNESRAFAAANSVTAGSKEDLLEAAKSYLYDSYQVEGKRVPQEAAGYDPYGASDGSGCASCHWFVAPSACVLVAGDISPTGKSNFFSSAESMRNMIYEAYDDSESKPSVLSRIITKVFGKKEAEPLSPFVLFRDKDDNLRFMAVYSNIFEDKHNQILTTESHKEYVEWVDDKKIYPDLHIWHCGDDSKIGEVDLVDFVDGFAFASGVISADKEDIAYKAADSDPGVSHGFIGLYQTNTGLWNAYRSFEISVLPAWAAGNENLDVLYAPGSKEYFMPFDAKKKQYLLSLGLDEDTVNSWESSAKDQGENLKKLVNYKAEREQGNGEGENELQERAPRHDQPGRDDDTEEKEQREEQEKEVQTQPVGAGASTATKSELAYIIKAHADADKNLSTLAETMVTLTEQVKSLQNDINNLKKPADQRAAEEWHSRAGATPGGFIATQSKANKTEEAENKAADNFFGEIVMKQVNDALGIGGS